MDQCESPEGVSEQVASQVGCLLALHVDRCCQDVNQLSTVQQQAIAVTTHTLHKQWWYGADISYIHSCSRTSAFILYGLFVFIRVTSVEDVAQ